MMCSIWVVLLWVWLVVSRLVCSLVNILLMVCCSVCLVGFSISWCFWWVKILKFSVVFRLWICWLMVLCVRCRFLVVVCRFFVWVVVWKVVR